MSNRVNLRAIDFEGEKDPDYVDHTDDGERARERDDAKHTGGLGGLETVARENNKCLCHIVVV